MRAQEVFRNICDLITQSTKQRGSAIVHFWRSRLLVTLAKITITNAQKWALAHSRPRDPDSRQRWRRARRGFDGEDRDSRWREGDERQDGNEGDWHQVRDPGSHQGGYKFLLFWFSSKALALKSVKYL